MENSVDNKDAVDVATLVKYYNEYEENTYNSREASEKNRDYYDNKQWTAEETTALEKRKQPVITFNLVKRTVDALLGAEKQFRTDPKALPRTPIHEEDAHACTDAIRFVCDNNDFDQVASDGFEHLLIEGTEAADIQVEDNGKELEIKVYPVMWDRVFYDVHSRRKDFSDAKYKGVVIWMDYDDARLREKWDKDALEAAVANKESPYNDTHEDRPQYKWNDHDRKRVKICYIYHKHKGQWHYAYFTKGALLESGVSPYLDENGQPACALEFQSAFIDRDGNRYGYVKTLISPQDEVNKRRSKALHLINQRQTYGNGNTGIQAQDIKNELAKPDGHIDLKHGEFGRDFGIIPTTDMATGNFQLLQEAKEVFNVVGANTSVTGKEDRVMSGRAEAIRQQAGFRELAPVMDAHSSWKKRIYRQIWNRVRQFWNEERWIRVTDDENNLKWVGLNQPITLEQQLAQEFNGDPMYMEALQAFQGDPRLGQVVGMKNQLSELDVDILIEEAPDMATIQEEQFELVSNMAMTRPEVPLEAVVELSTLRNKDAFLEKIKGNQEMQQMQQQKQQEAEAIAKDKEVAEIEKTRADTAKSEATAIKTMREINPSVSL